jgi:hypothetical protein
VEETAQAAVSSVTTLDIGHWEVVSPSGQSYQVSLWEENGGWYGHCSCPQFAEYVKTPGPGQLVQPCTHLVWLKRKLLADAKNFRFPESPLPEAALLAAQEPERRESGAREPTPPEEVRETVRPPLTVDPETARAAIAGTRAVLDAVIGPEDVVELQGKTYIKRSGFRKLALAYSLSTQIIARGWETVGQETLAYSHARVFAPDGRFADGQGWCALGEQPAKRGKRKPEELEHRPILPQDYHVAAATADTRALNRAIADLVGGGAVSAEEIDATLVTQEAPALAPTPKPKPSPSPPVTERQLRLLERLKAQIGEPRFREVTGFSSPQDLAALSKREATQVINTVLAEIRRTGFPDD